MGRVTFVCECGKFEFRNNTDFRSYVAHLIPDQDWDGFWSAIDDAIENTAGSKWRKDVACMKLREYKARMVWQCPVCGSLYVDGITGEHHRFTPASESVPTDLLSGVGKPVDIP